MKQYLNLGFYLLAIAIPLYLAIRVYNPTEHALQNTDDTNMAAVDVLARAASSLDKQAKLDPVLNCESKDWVNSCLLPTGAIATAPEGFQEVQISVSGTQYIIYVKLNSLADTQKCFTSQETYYLYNSKDDRKGFVCSEGTPQIGSLYFIP